MGGSSAVNQSDRDVAGLLPTGTVTLLAAEVEDSSRPREAEPDQMGVGALLDDAVWDMVAAHHGVRQVDGSERDSFVAAFTRASDALACAVELQRRAPPVPIRLRIGLHTGEVPLDDGNYLGPTMNRAARLRDLAHGGQTVLSGTTHDVA
ncbi:MAG: adenylate/guanylate cyclase domain-containing protein, partial [Mycobacterium sp.]|uniref:adenylate/guanylate cyclase domain-containing protein n=1 Tax=Mycobacterium sp. TaxID=1785 RepID=UPI003F9449B0